VSAYDKEHLQLRPTDRPPRPVNRKMRLKESGGLAAGLMLTPALIFLCVCSIYPFVWIFRYIGYDYNGFTARYVGTANFTRMFSDTTFWSSVLTTFEYAFWKLIIIIPLALIMAVLLNQKLRGSDFFRGAYFMPTVIATSISGMIFTFIFATQNGILNNILQTVGLMGKTPINWLMDSNFAMEAVIILSVWAGFGNYMLYFVTGMTSISEDVYESSRIDGAKAVQTFFKITLPMLKPVLKPVLATIAILSFRQGWNEYIMPRVFTMTNDNLRPLTVGVNMLKNAGDGAAAWNIMFAGATIAIIPILIVFICFSRYFMGGLTAGAVKG